MENNQILIQNILNDYEQGMPINEIKNINDIEKAQIYKIVQKHGTPDTTKKRNAIKRNTLKEKKMAIDMETIIKELKNGAPMPQILKKYDIHYNTLKSQIDRYAEEKNIDLQEIISPNNARYFRTNKVQIPIEEIVKAVEERRQLKEIADKYEVTTTTVSEQKKQYEQTHGKIECKVKPVIKVRGVPINPETYGKRKKKEFNNEKVKEEKHKKTNARKMKKKVSISELWQEYINHTPVSDLVARYGIDESVLRKQLNEYRNYLLTEAYLNHNKTIREIAQDSQLPIMEVKERIRTVLREKVPTVPTGWYLVQRSRGYTEEC